MLLNRIKYLIYIIEISFALSGGLLKTVTIRLRIDIKKNNNIDI